ncbi:tagatose-bisphosphate aldolase noncatalytic subunit [Yoonia maricola]|uniref:Tagatose-bisphosphate aldolase noncatalytic subunit n=1 Tax=Yoonia maricola TaxID=420999 RepID=A0A2M8WLR4_9RHOB|nr:D-tagatose-bisphosphate aldolase, class II, non-catalytic subunit [Yoonia maricola]PJI91871.1 tagatose-bisphosphate aldolase noncatalytic subunit [Yoonia maricola]
MQTSYLSDLITAHDFGNPKGIAAICSAHPIVLAATLAQGAKSDRPVLIEATCNQVNQDGGYTGMTPADFHARVHQSAQSEGFDTNNLILGGDHLGPNPWRHLPAAQAMDKAKAMVAAYAAAGFGKIHLDTSMACADDTAPLSEEVITTRAASLATVAEDHAAGQNIVYVIGTEVPVPGGATEHVETLTLTSPTDAATTVGLHKEAFRSAGLGKAIDRIVSLVVQPGVEFGHENVVPYAPVAAAPLSQARKNMGLIYEAHSTDYQSPEALAALVNDGFAILKVGPWLTFALREALYGLDAIAQELTGVASLQSGMENLMIAHPEHWQGYYHGSADNQRLQRHFSYSDRIRYYWATSEAEALVQDLIARLADKPIPETLISQYLPMAWPGVMSGAQDPTAAALLKGSVQRVLTIYDQACNPL